jgi:hypothetical protein
MAQTRRTKQAQTSTEVAIVEGVFRAIGQLASLAWKSLRKGELSPSVSAVERQKLQQGWEQVELLLMQGSSALAVSEADKLLDAGLKAIGARGETMGERLKSSQKRFAGDLYNAIWNAHKLRNQLAHEVGVQVSHSQAQLAVGAFRQALSALGLI